MTTARALTADAVAGMAWQNTMSESERADGLQWLQAAHPDEEISKLRIPPHSVEAEQSVLGGLLLDNSAWDRAGDLLIDSDFYRFEHRLIYAAIGTLIAATKPADVITVFEQLQSLGKAEDFGGLVYSA